MSVPASRRGDRGPPSSPLLSLETVPEVASIPIVDRGGWKRRYAGRCSHERQSQLADRQRDTSNWHRYQHDLAKRSQGPAIRSRKSALGSHKPAIQSRVTTTRSREATIEFPDFCAARSCAAPCRRDDSAKGLKQRDNIPQVQERHSKARSARSGR